MGQGTGKAKASKPKASKPTASTAKASKPKASKPTASTAKANKPKASKPTASTAKAEAVPPSRGGRRTATIVGAAALVFVLIAGSLGGSFFLGQSTRKSDDQVRLEKQAAVDTAVLRTQRAEQAVLKATRARDRKVMKNKVKQLRKAADARAARSYAAGNASGYSSGTEDGLNKGSDSLTCSDDADVYWLPACNY